MATEFLRASCNVTLSGRGEALPDAMRAVRRQLSFQQLLKQHNNALFDPTESTKRSQNRTLRDKGGQRPYPSGENRTLTDNSGQHATIFVWQMEEYSSKTYKIGFLQTSYLRLN
jgi:hypothetical protein